MPAGLWPEPRNSGLVPDDSPAIKRLNAILMRTTILMILAASLIGGTAPARTENFTTHDKKEEAYHLLKHLNMTAIKRMLTQIFNSLYR